METAVLIDILTASAAAIAVIVSFYAVWISRRGVITAAISANRIEWIGEVRGLIRDFLIEYKRVARKENLTDIYSHIMLFLNPYSDVYVGLAEAMKRCINEGYTDDNYWSVVQNGQIVLDISWRRIKREAGVTYNRERRNGRRARREKNKKRDGSRLFWSADLRKEEHIAI